VSSNASIVVFDEWVEPEHFMKALYASSEMLVDGFLDLYGAES